MENETNLAAAEDAVMELQRTHRRLQAEKREAEVAGWNLLTDFPGTLLDAIKIGLVKPSIPLPQGWLQQILAGK